MSKFFPNCPPENRDAIIAMVSTSEFADIDIKTATAMCARSHVRCTMTDFESIKKIEAMTRSEALLIVKDEVADIILSWK